ncbi:ATP-binding cassette domain-containing protein [uncultured Albimonas sp.]|uniref:ATP-binding cassette domain-containing protein n=1 Tax=uncultured Albimonas sp. TaxID=1331701 RepID=UPI0030EDA113
MLSAAGLALAFAGRAVLTDVALSLGPGEVVGLGGPSGAGKSTLGRILAGRLEADAGQVTLDGLPRSPARPGRPAPVQYAPQSAELAVDPRWSVARILANAGPPDAEAVAALGVREAWASRRPSELSGGELARVSLARLFHPGLRHLVCDEVSSQLDALEQDGVLRALTALARDRGIGLLLISHGAGLRRRFCDRDLTLADGRLNATPAS